MNCLEFRRRCGSTPKDQDRDFLAHAAECPACSAYADRARRFDELIYDALRVDVPLLDARREPGRVGRAGWTRRRAAIAAVLVVAVGIGTAVRLTVTDRASATLGDAVIAHLRQEREAFDPGLRPLDAAAVRQTLARHGVRIGEDAGAVLYLRMCLVNGKEVPHLVVQGASGPVTVMLFRGEPSGVTTAIGANRLSGRIVPVSGGSVAIVGHEEPVDASTEMRIVGSIRWDA
jgi:hypothetical protein